MRNVFWFLSTALILVACSSPVSDPAPIMSLETETPAIAITPSEEEPTSTSIATPSNTIPSATSGSTPTAILASTGWGLSRFDAAQLYGVFGFDFELSTNDDNQEVFTGTISDNMCVVSIVGPKDNILSMGAKVFIPNPPSEKDSMRTMAYLTAVISVAAKDWPEAMDWFNASMNVFGESRISFDHREAVLVVSPEEERTVVELTIRAIDPVLE